jgi:pantoate--beta-alanine ligase
VIVARTIGELDLPRHGVIGLVPTMGALHAGHAALFEAARPECDVLVASVFVNPAQFESGADLDSYPRDFARDSEIAEAEGVDVIFAPSALEMYPTGFATWVSPAGAAEGLEEAYRPGHFRGVATVCVKLFSTLGAERVYFGAKDGQQVAVLRRVIADLDLAPELVVCPTVREPDGLALSSRNVYLSAAERAAAPALHRALSAISAAVADGETDRERAVARGRAELLAGTREAYLDVVDPATFTAPERIGPGALAIGSVWVGSTRLIDNLPLATAPVAQPAAGAGR